eukprot:39004-Eustigmatos_ZCMA.PRE.1
MECREILGRLRALVALSVRSRCPPDLCIDLSFTCMCHCQTHTNHTERQPRCVVRLKPTHESL